jgi:hypothetical protein
VPLFLELLTLCYLLDVKTGSKIMKQSYKIPDVVEESEQNGKGVKWE